MRVEAAVRRTDPATTGLGRLAIEDFALTSDRADLAILVNRGVPASVVDATVVQCAEELALSGHRVTVYTSDVRDIERLQGRSSSRVSVRRV